MAEVSWIKIVTDIFDDEKILLIETMPEADTLIVIWFKLLCLAGKQNNSGVFTIHERMPYTDEMFAAIFRRPINTIRLALATFERYGMIEIINDTVTIPNWGKHQSLDQLEAKKNYMRGYMREYREKQKQKLLADDNSNCKTNNKSNVSEADKNREDKEKKREDKKVSKKKTESFDSIIDSYTQSEDLKNALLEFVKMRQRIKKPMTNYALTLLTKKLDKLATSADMKLNILNQSIVNGWQDVYPLKSAGKQQANDDRFYAPNDKKEIGASFNFDFD